MESIEWNKELEGEKKKAATQIRFICVSQQDCESAERPCEGENEEFDHVVYSSRLSEALFIVEEEIHWRPLHCGGLPNSKKCLQAPGLFL